MPPDRSRPLTILSRHNCNIPVALKAKERHDARVQRIRAAEAGDEMGSPLVTKRRRALLNDSPAVLQSHFRPGATLQKQTLVPHTLPRTRHSHAQSGRRDPLSSTWLFIVSCGFSTHQGAWPKGPGTPRILSCTERLIG